MTSPATQKANATLIANYQIKSPEGFALSRPGASETVAMVPAINPDFQAARFDEVQDAFKKFGAGKEGDNIRALDVGVQHLALFDLAAKNMNNTDVNMVNYLKNAFQREFGATAPTNLEALKHVVATEVLKATGGGIGTGEDRYGVMKTMDGANSPQQLQDVTNGFRNLMAGQLDGLRRQYVSSTGITKGPFAFESKLGPEAIKALAPQASPQAPPSPNPNVIRYDASGNRVAQ
jgi:hypothetical protein